MRKRYVFGLGLVLLAIMLAVVVWLASVNFGDHGPANATQTFTFWAISTLIFILTVTLIVRLVKIGVKLYLERQSGREGSRIKSKLVFGALALSFLPVVFLYVFGYVILSHNIDKWFSRPAEGVKIDLADTAVAMGDEVQGRAQALAAWLAEKPGLTGGGTDFAKLCRDNRIAELRIEDAAGVGMPVCPDRGGAGPLFTARAALPDGNTLVLRIRPRADLAQRQSQLQGFVAEYDQLSANRRSIRNLYMLFLLCIALFILFVATWIALILSREISVPISALLEAAGQVRKGNLSRRVVTRANDEMATLVRAFNEMMQALEANSRELESRRQFTEAILESIPTGVISLTASGEIQRVNRALRGLFAQDRIEHARRLDDLFSAEDVREIRYLMKRAQRTGVAASQFDLETSGPEPQTGVRHLAVTVSALPERLPALTEIPAKASKDPDRTAGSAPGFVLVLEDTSELLRAQKAAAWHEVARRIAHELKNPLTPIALSAERIARLLDRGAFTPEFQRILGDCSATISREVESVKNLADEFSRFSRFPEVQPVPSDLNAVVRNALGVFAGRLDGIDLRTDLAPGLPPVHVDPEQFKRVVVNLVDNAAEAMRDSLVKRLMVATRATSADSVELLVADTGCGVSAEDKEKLFLPYFSTKGRGTGLGLAIVSHILAEHRGRIRVEDNRPVGASFYVEVPVGVAAEAEARA
jgi:two-component system, NtrC family, nitrogen regulation sensor histidine kinase NtrY